MACRYLGNCTLFLVNYFVAEQEKTEKQQQLITRGTQNFVYGGKPI